MSDEYLSIFISLKEDLVVGYLITHFFISNTFVSYARLFSKYYKLIKIPLRLVYKITENSSLLWLFAEFIQSQKRYPVSYNEISILTWRLLVTWIQNFSSDLYFSGAYSLQNISYLSVQLKGRSYNQLKKSCNLV